MCLCNCSKSAKKKRRAPLTQKEMAHAYMSVFCFNGLKSVVLKLQCLKTRVHATDVVSRLERAARSPPVSVSPRLNKGFSCQEKRGQNCRVLSRVAKLRSVVSLQHG